MGFRTFVSLTWKKLVEKKNSRCIPVLLTHGSKSDRDCNFSHARWQQYDLCGWCYYVLLKTSTKVSTTAKCRDNYLHLPLLVNPPWGVRKHKGPFRLSVWSAKHELWVTEFSLLPEVGVSDHAWPSSDTAVWSFSIQTVWAIRQFSGIRPFLLVMQPA